jgi:hypothetical protein
LDLKKGLGFHEISEEKTNIKIKQLEDQKNSSI